MNASTYAQPIPQSLALRSATLSEHLTQATADPAEHAAQRRLARQLAAPVLLVASLVALWSGTAPLAGAVVAAGQVQAEFGRAVVQHQEGGLLRELKVRAGQAVRRGEPLLVIGDLRQDAAVDVLKRQRDLERLRLARASAEMTLAAQVDWPLDALDAGDDARQREQQLFDTRRRALAERVDALQAQQAQLRGQMAALGEQLGASQRAAALSRAEFEVNRELVASGFIQKTRLMTMERLTADAEARSAAARSQVAEAGSQLAALGLAVAQARADYRQQAADAVKDATARIGELNDRLRPGVDQLERQTVRAPVDGVVMALRVSAAGTAVGPREPLLEIAPSGEPLLVETWIEPHDIDHVRAGGAAEVRLSAYDSRRVPLLAATVRSVSPDAQAPADGQPPRYRAQVEVSADELARHAGLRLQAGMPVEVFVTTPPRNLFAYLAEPLGGFARRALREP